jgi:anti-sigma factor RsiW
MEDPRLTHLLNGYFDGDLTGAEKVELERILKESAEARRFFWEYATLNALTHEASKWKWAETSQAEEPEAASVGAASGPTARKSRVGWIGWTWGLGWRWGLAAGFALLLGGSALFYWSVTASRDVARLARAVDAEWANGTYGPGVGALLAPGWLRLARGAVEVEFRSGARVVFEGPAEIQLISEMESFCQLGRFRVQVPEEAHGFKMEIAGLDVVDLGTEFGLSVPPAGQAEVHVFAGRVEVTRTNPVPASLLLEEGEAVRVEPEAFLRMDASHTGFLSGADLARRELPEVRRRYQEWKEASRALNADPATILHYTFEDESTWDQVLTNQVAKAEPETHGTIVGCQWVEGRWPGKKSLQFNDAQDRVRLRLPQPFKVMTFLAWARVDGLPNAFVHSILTADREQAGSVRWTISHAGEMRLGLASKGTGPEAVWRVGISPAVISKDHLGQWLLLATTYDGATVTHYLNGQLVSSGKVAAPETLEFGWVELGNWVATPEHPDFQWAKGRAQSFFDRHFDGRIGEVAVLARVMTAEEILRLFKSGQALSPPALAAQLAEAPGGDGVAGSRTK